MNLTRANQNGGIPIRRSCKVMRVTGPTLRRSAGLRRPRNDFGNPNNLLNTSIIKEL